jgi:agmatinase
MPSDLTFKPHRFPFAGAAIPRSIDLLEADAAIFAAPHGTPYDGIDNSPHASTADALRQAISADAGWRNHWDFDLGAPLLGDGTFQLADLGDLPTQPRSGAHNRALIEAATRTIVAQGTVPIMIGGDDSTPIPFINALADHAPLTVLQIDAHIDWRRQRRGETLGFSSTMRRASEMPHVERIVQAGIRGLGSARKKELDDARLWGAHIIPAALIHAAGVKEALDLIPKNVNCMISLDCDAIDGATMPAVMSPTPGGLTYRQVIELIAGAASRARLVAFDLIEFVPARDPTGYAAHVAARIVWHVIGRLANHHAHSAAIAAGRDLPPR